MDKVFNLVNGQPLPNILSVVASSLGCCAALSVAFSVADGVVFSGVASSVANGLAIFYTLSLLKVNRELSASKLYHNIFLMFGKERFNCYYNES
ncbi:MAG: hypothetical protein PUP91_13115 [Rhizonema sp. PD37]|nr:hypothetical protein [Rhizonema sp. PD37]